ncbi:MAG: tetratricopeptide repeat protein [Anaerolineae bacterium]
MVKETFVSGSTEPVLSPAVSPVVSGTNCEAEGLTEVLSRTMRKRFAKSLLLVLLTVLWLLVGGVGRATGQEETRLYAGNSLAPTDVDTKVKMISQKVDAYIVTEDDRTVVMVLAAFKLHNPDKFSPVDITLGFPSWSGDNLYFEPEQLSDFKVVIGDEELELIKTPVELQRGDQVQAEQWYTWTMTLTEDQRVTVKMEYQQDLGNEAKPTFLFVPATAAGWAAVVGSARFTVHFPQMTTSEQLQVVSPAGASFDGQLLTWLFLDQEPTEVISLTFIKPQLWGEIVETRAAIATDPDSATVHHRLGLLYRQLSTTPNDLGHIEDWGYYAQAVNELEVAQQLDPTLLQTYLDLADLYAIRAQSEQGEMQANYRALAIANWDKALSLQPDNPEIKGLLAEHYYQLALHAYSKGYHQEAIEYLSKAAEVISPEMNLPFTVNDIERLKQSGYAGMAEAWLEKGELEEAFTLIQEEVRGEALEDFRHYRPRFSAIRGRLDTFPGERQMVFNLIPYPAISPQLTAELEVVAELMAQQSGGRATLSEADGEYLLRLTVPFTDGGDLLRRMRASAQAVSTEPDLAPVLAVLNPTALDWAQTEGTLTTHFMFREAVNLEQAQTILEGVATEIEAVTRTLEESPPANKEEVYQLRLRALRGYQEAWEDLMRGIFTYRTTFLSPDGEFLTRSWQVGVGEVKELRYETKTYDKGALLAISAGGAAIILVVDLLAWLLWKRLTKR